MTVPTAADAAANLEKARQTTSPIALYGRLLVRKDGFFEEWGDETMSMLAKVYYEREVLRIAAAGSLPATTRVDGASVWYDTNEVQHVRVIIGAKMVHTSNF